MARVMMPVDSQQGEALDSQVVWANIVEELGVGAGAGALSGRQGHIDHNHQTRPSPVLGSGGDNKVGQPLGAVEETSDAAPDPDIATSEPAPAVDAIAELRAKEPASHSSHREAAVGIGSFPPSASTENDARQRTGRDSQRVAAMTREMDRPQESPTQVNEDRDYDAPYDSLLSDTAPDTARATQDGPDERTLQDHDTGVVNLAGDYSEPARPSSQISEDGGFDNTRGEWRQQDQTSQQFSTANALTPFKQAQGLAPETPALPKNPLAARPGISAPLAGSQLFGQTQLSSAVKPPGFTPTSSRPSPNIPLNSFSPYVGETSPLKDRQNVSSPTTLRTSSPQREEVPATVVRSKPMERIVEETPLHARPTETDEATVLGSPTARVPKSSASRQPLAHYETMQKSQERKLNGGSVYDFVASDSDEDDDDMVRRLERRRRVERKKAQAAEEMERVRYTPLVRQDEPERRPSRKRRRSVSDAEDAGHTETPRPSYPSKGSSEPLLVKDSQRRGAAASRDASLDVSTQGTEDPVPEPQLIPADHRVVAGSDVADQPASEDRIPATSPAALSPSPDRGAAPQPQSEPDLPDLGQEAQVQASLNDGGSSSLPPPTRRSGQLAHGRVARPPRRKTAISSSASDLPSNERARGGDSESAYTLHQNSTADKEETVEGDAGQDVNQAPATPLEEHGAGLGPGSAEAKAQPQPRRPPEPMTTRSRGKGRSVSSAMDIDADGGHEFNTSSTMSPLSTAPASSEVTTPATGFDALGSERAESVGLPSPAGGRSLRKRALGRSGLSASPQPAARPTRAARRRAPARYGSESTDEQQAPPASTAESSTADAGRRRSNASRRPARASTGSMLRGRRLFEGMVFAVSLASGKPSAAQSRRRLGAKIEQAGGTVLEGGFDELFERLRVMEATGPVFDVEQPMTLARAHRGTGFTALIADGHSRKAKYMQALALGLPCLAHQWVTACLGRGELVGWEAYLLCAGSSAVLDNAVRSRSLAAYEAAGARLAEVVERRGRMLRGQRVLAVVEGRKASGGGGTQQQQYVFLAQAMGPSLSRVFTAEQAREALAANAEQGRPFDWVYVDKAVGPAESVLYAAPEPGPGDGAGGGGGGSSSSSRKRRKKNPTAATAAAPVALSEHTRVLDDELVIQSLILGRMVEEDEMWE